jgi:hypothetical protein
MDTQLLHDQQVEIDPRQPLGALGLLRERQPICIVATGLDA